MKLLITTYDATTDEIESERTIDHSDKRDRIWLGKHCYWAFRNGRGVDTKPVEHNNTEGS